MNDLTLPKRVKNVLGQKFGILTVVRHVGVRTDIKARSHYWECLCDCGKTTQVASSNLLSGAVKSCGCVTPLLNKKRITHGHTSQNSVTRTYRIYQGMLTRCYNPDRDFWHLYGGKGIKVCDRWFRSFENFLTDMGEAPNGLTLDRIDSNGDYEPSNCRWATWSRQARNRSTTRMLTWDGRTQAASDWADEVNIPLSTLLGRIDRYKWNLDKAFTEPVKFRERNTPTNHCNTNLAPQKHSKDGQGNQRYICPACRKSWAA